VARTGRSRASGFLVAVSLGAIVGAARVAALDCSVPDEAAACASNADCRCGLDPAQACAVGVRECVGQDPSTQCFSFCAEYNGGLAPVCRDGRCVRAGLARCPGDCDSDVRVDVDELVVGVGITLGAQTLAACRSYDRDGDDVTGIADLVAAVTAAMGDCATALPTFPGDRGVFDGMITSGGEINGEHEVVADLQEYADDLYLDIQVSPNLGIALHGPLDQNPVALEGYYAITDYGIGTAGTATITDDGNEVVIEGMVANEIPGRPSMTSFTLRRSRTADPTRFSGRYRFAALESPSGNDTSSIFEFGMVVGRDGQALSTEGSDVSGGGETFGRLVSGTCRVAPQGHFHCRTVYLIEGTDLTTPLRLTGVLPENESATGSGRSLSGYDPPFGPEPYVPSFWTATRE
jgi:hypothetical protein